jgi:acetoin utilization deacetylase AcuC-like enzyme
MKSNPVQGRSLSAPSAAHQQEQEWCAPRIAIVDIDVHHGELGCLVVYSTYPFLTTLYLLFFSGNGTEEIVRNLK